MERSIFAYRDQAHHRLVRETGRKEKKAETWLYDPIKHHLERLGYAVKGEVRQCDLVALRESDRSALVIGELKPTFTLDLVLQGVDRASACDEIWLVIGMSRRGAGREGDRRVLKLCRMLGFGLFGIAEDGRVHVLVPPGAYKPRGNLKRRSEMLEEHRMREGDPVLGGSSTASPVMTAYRQQALAIARLLEAGPQRPRDLKAQFPKAQSFLSKNYYGWFVAVERGWYGLTDAGRSALLRWPTSSNLGIDSLNSAEANGDAPLIDAADQLSAGLNSCD